MEHHRISTSPAAPGAPSARSKAPASLSPVAGGGAEDPATAGGFLSLLSALGDGAAANELTSDAAQLLPVLPQADPALWAQGMPPPDGAPLSYAALTPGGVPASDAGQAWHRPNGLQPQSGFAGRSDGTATLSLAEAAQQAGLLGAELLGQGGLVAQTAKMDAAVESPAMAGQGSAMAGYQRAFARLQGVLSQGAAPGLPGAAGVGATASPGRGQVAAQPMGAAAPLPVPSAVAPTPERMEAAAPVAGVFSEVQSPALPAAGLAATEPQARPAEQRGAAEPGMGTGALGGAYEGQGRDSTDGGGVALADPQAAGLEDAATEQAAYWVGENLQNAELTVQHDGMPVEVRVSLSGNEAHVAFGSDESQTRDLLDASQDQLRSMLGSEGLVLSGVSVGESGARDASGEGAASQRGRSSGRRTVQVAGAGGAGAEAPGRPAVLTDRAVDVFV